MSLALERPILITGLVACVGLLPDAFSHAIGSDR
jgi:Cu/Ag efflux pump CusA